MSSAFWVLAIFWAAHEIISSWDFVGNEREFRIPKESKCNFCVVITERKGKEKECKKSYKIEKTKKHTHIDEVKKCFKSKLELKQH